MVNTNTLLWFAGMICFSCSEDNGSLDEISPIDFGVPVLVTIEGYNGHVMEPFISRDGTVLFFNNLNVPTENTNLHWCTRINDTLFRYEGEIENINTPSLEGVPTMDKDNVFYFIHTGSYEETLSTIYKGEFAAGSVLNSVLVDNVSRNTAGWVNFDVEVSNDGNTLYFVDGRFDANGGPYESNLVIAEKEGEQFFRSNDSDEILQNINTEDLEYAAAITKDELEICFTRVPANGRSEPKIYIAERESADEPFANVHQIENLSGFVEAATYSQDDQGIYFHKKEEDLHRLYYVRKQ